MCGSSDPSFDPFAALSGRPSTPDGVFRVILVIAGASAPQSMLELIGVLHVDPRIDLQLVASCEALKACSQSDVDRKLSEVRGAGGSAGTNKSLRIWTDEDDDTDEWRESSARLPLTSQLLRWADLLLLAPCSATLLASLATGVCNSLPSRLLRSISDPNKTPVLIYPSMNADMFENVWTMRHIATLQDNGYVILGPQGREGVKGRMIDWQDILIAVQDMATFFNIRKQEAYLRQTEESLRDSPEAGESSTETGAKQSAKRPREEQMKPPDFSLFAPGWCETNPEIYDMGFKIGQRHWQNKIPVTTGRSLGLGRREFDLTSPTWKQDGKAQDRGEQTEGPQLFPYTKNWWA